MFLVREVMHCKPGKVKEMVNKFNGVSAVMKKLGYKPFQLFTDVSGAPFWTVVAQTEVKSMDELLAMEEKVMAEDEARKAMAGYHELVRDGRREVYRIVE